MFYASYKGVGNKVFKCESLLEQLIMSYWVLFACYFLLNFCFFFGFFWQKSERIDVSWPKNVE